MAISVVKESGDEEDFQRQKIVESCVGCGAPRDLAEKIGDEVKMLWKMECQPRRFVIWFYRSSVIFDKNG